MATNPEAQRDHKRDPAIRAVAALQDQLRRGMYLFIRRMGRPVTREEAAAAVGISRKLAAFHLDKLVQAGVLQAHYQAVGETPKVGRTPKVYEPSEIDIQLSIPQRGHDILADILLDAVLTDDDNTSAAALAAAHHRGEQIGRAERHRGRPGRLGAERALTLVIDVLAEHGYEPAREAGTRVRLRNCPFHPMAAKAPELVCGLNHALLTGMLTGLDAPTVEAVLDPRAGECCVELRSAHQTTSPHR